MAMMANARVQEVAAHVQQGVDEEGVAVAHRDQLPWEGIDFTLLAQCIVRLMQHGWPATFILMYDEVGAHGRRRLALHSIKQPPAEQGARHAQPGPAAGGTRVHPLARGAGKGCSAMISRHARVASVGAGVEPDPSAGRAHGPGHGQPRQHGHPGLVRGRARVRQGRPVQDGEVLRLVVQGRGVCVRVLPDDGGRAQVM